MNDYEKYTGVVRLMLQNYLSPLFKAVFCVVLLALAGCSSNRSAPGTAPAVSFSLENVQGVSAHAPQRIALMLPLKGSQAALGQAVRDGFLSAYYQAVHPSMTVQIYDTEGKADKVPALYQEALAKQADIIIGPLNKAEVQALANLKPALPVLALNTVVARPPTKQFVQYGLLPEDEIVSVTDLAWARNLRQGVILATKNERGKRLAKNFSDLWTAKGGKILQVVTLQSRADVQERLKNLIVEYKEKADNGDASAPDVFFLATSADVAREIKPLLDFHYSPKTPVFASASIYSGVPSPLKDQDLNGVEFCDVPWVLDGSESVVAERQNAERQWTRSFQQSPRLFALGIDAFRLVTQWPEFTTGATRVAGMTGTLELGAANQQVRRRLFCSKFVHGQPQ